MFRQHLWCRVIVEGHAVVDFETVAAADDLVEQPRPHRGLVQPGSHKLNAQLRQTRRDAEVIYRFGAGECRLDSGFVLEPRGLNQRFDQAADPGLGAALSDEQGQLGGVHHRGGG
ncbi:hypothetical protein D3C78_1539150 [compost metagenome]